MHTDRNDLTLDELLADPVTLAIMKADRVDPTALDVMLRSMAADFGGGWRPARRNPAVRLARWVGRLWERSPCGSRDRSQFCGAS